MERQKWLEWRRQGIGSSDAAILMGVSPWSTPYELWRDKVFEVEEQEDNPAMARGRLLEPVVRAYLEEKEEEFLMPNNLVHPLFPWMRASIDAMSFCGKKVFEINVRISKIMNSLYPG